MECYEHHMANPDFLVRNEPPQSRALKSLGVVSVGDALTYYPFRVTEPVPARALREAKIGEKMAFAAHVRGVRVFPMAVADSG